MLNLKAAITADIAEGLGKAFPDLKDTPAIIVDHTENPEHGDYASPVALALTKTLKLPPLDIIAKISEAMPKKEYIGKVEAAAPGFLNVRINPGWMTARLDDVIQQGLAGPDVDIGKGKLVNIEFISANPTGPLTLGNARPAFTADTLANVMTATGYNVTREYYINDAGAQARKLGESILRRILQAEGEPVDYPEEMYQGEYIKEVATTVAERWREDEGKEFDVADLTNREIITRLSQEAIALLQEQIKQTITDDLKIRFDIWTSERKLRASGWIEKMMAQLRSSDETYQKDGAEYLRTTKYGDEEDRVVVKKDGDYTYFTPDIVYHQNKYDRGFDEIFTFLGADHQGHIPRLNAAMQALSKDTSKLHFLVSQWFRLVKGNEVIKLSKRRGEIYTPKQLIDEVGYDAARYFLTAHSLGTHMDFDLDLAREQSERNPVYYVQYAYVRLQSILRRAKEEGVIANIGDAIELSSRAELTQTAEVNLMKMMYRWSEVVVDIAGTYTVHQLPYYALELARAVHTFYKHAPVIAAGDKGLVMGRLQLVLAVRKVLGETLDLLGLSKPEVM